MDDEEALVRSCAAGDPVAWRRFVDRYSDWVLGIARAWLRRSGVLGEADAEDARSEVFRQLLDRDRAALRALRAPVRLRAWLAIVTRRACGKLLRKKPSPPPRPTEPARTPAGGPEALSELLGRLPAEDRLLLLLHFAHGASYREIADLLGISVESVGKAKFRALERLRGLQADREPEQEP
jgi:DNA-directed RNA polymerase specialized sigma24 family protein